MRKITQSIPLMLMMLVFIGGSAQARGTKTAWRKLHKVNTTEDIAKLEPGDKVTMTCKKCDAVSMAEISSKEEAENMAKEGATYDCPSCKNVAKVSYMGPPSKKHRVVKFVDEHGEECMTMNVVHDAESSDE